MAKKLKLLTSNKDKKGVLKQRLTEVEDPSSKIEVLKEMLDIMKQNNGIGLTANQVGLTDRMFIYTMNSGRVEFVINPEIIKTSKRMAWFNEGCLSYPGKQVQIQRPVQIKVKYHNGHNIVIKNLKGMEARVWLHEYDHCEGECIVSKEV